MPHTVPMNFHMRAFAGISIAAVLAIGVAAPAAQADDYMTLNPTELEQTVLRAQMPKTLGSWSQNYYFSEKDSRYTRPTLCWDNKGTVKLPSAQNMGAVAYAINSNASGTVTIYQYATAAKAQAALAAMRSANCYDSPTIMTDEGDKVPGQSGSDFTDDSTTGYAAGVSYKQDDKIIFEDLITTQRGLAIVQTEVFRALPSTLTAKQQQNTASKNASVNKAWHTKVLRAYESFGQGSSS